MKTKEVEKYKVYGLYDPISGELNYIGVTKNELSVRLKGHTSDTIDYPHRCLTAPRVLWLKSLKKLNLKPVIRLLKSYKTEEHALKYEELLIKKYQKTGKLLNISTGGKGARGVTRGEYVRKAVSESRSVPICQYDLDMNFIKEYKSTTEAAVSLSISRTGITNCIRGRYKTSGGFKWKKK